MIEVPSLTISTTSSSVSAIWPALPCVDHYILKLETVGPVQGATYGSDIVYLYSGPIVNNVLEDDEDYADEEEGSGAEGYSTTRPKREMTVLSLSKDTIITATTIRPRFAAGAFLNIF